MNCPHCNARLKSSDVNGSYCWCPKCRTHVEAKIPASEWKRHIQTLSEDPSRASLSDVQKMAKELLEANK